MTAIVLRNSKRKHRLPSRKTWRWLQIGEWTQKGDMTCDQRAQPIEMIGPISWQITSETHPVRRRIA